MSEQLLIAIVDDDRAFGLSLRRLLKSLGYSVAIFTSAPEFLASRELTTARCLVADIHMPAMTGVDLYLHLIAAGPVIPTILVTAYPDDADEKRMLRLGVASYLRKPLEETALIESLRAVFGRISPGDTA